MTKTANHTRKVRALLAKTTANGCEPAEAASALTMASIIVAKHGLNPTDFIWPEPPTGYRWEGQRGHGGTIVEAPAPKPRRTKAKSAEPKQPRRTKKEIIVAMLRQPGGTTIHAITALFGTKPHSARAAISVYGREIGGVTYEPVTKAYRAKA
jgi:hypothetical protein